MILITGFEPFDSAKTNPSYEAIKLLPDTLGDKQIEKLELPVVFKEAADIVINRLKTTAYDAVIMIGVAGTRDAITPEVIAINLADARIPDNKGNSPKWQKISESASDGLFSTLPVKEMAAAMGKENIKASLSYSAGTYVCNDTFFRVLSYIKDNDLGIPCGFIHVPDPDAIKEGSGMTISDLSKALEICIKCL